MTPPWCLSYSSRHHPADERRFYNGIFEALFTPYQPREPAAKKQFQVLKLLKQLDLRMLMIDEIHNILSGSVSRQRQFLNVLKYLSNTLQIPLVAFGTQEALRGIQTDPQLANRFTPVPLPRWRMNREFLDVTGELRTALPLRQPSRLIEERLAQKLLVQSEGNLGELSALLTTAAIHAVKTEIEQINDAVLAAIDWVPPSERRRQAERLYDLGLSGQIWPTCPWGKACLRQLETSSWARSAQGTAVSIVREMSSTEAASRMHSPSMV